MIEPQLLTSGEWTFRWQPAQERPSRLLVLVHGLTGDENSMWMLVHNFSKNYAILAPRGIYLAEESGYTWRSNNRPLEGLPADNDLLPAAEKLLDFLDEWQATNRIHEPQRDMIGFSQGAAMTYLLCRLQPEKVRRFAPLSGFLPEGLDKQTGGERFSGKDIFVSHGRQDELIPLERARRDVGLLKQWGANVTYCESDAGHKVSRECLSAMEKFFRT